MKLFRLITALLILSFTCNTYAGGGNVWGENSFGNNQSKTSSNNSSLSNSGLSNNSFGKTNDSSTKNNKLTYKKDNNLIKRILKNVFGIKFKSKKSKINPSDISSVPLDGELGLLLLGAAVFGYRRLRGKDNKDEN